MYQEDLVSPILSQDKMEMQSISQQFLERQNQSQKELESPSLSQDKIKRQNICKRNKRGKAGFKRG